MTRPMLLVAAGEVRESLRKRVMWISLGVLLLASLAIVILPEVLPGDELERDLVTAGDVPGELVDELTAAAVSIDMELRVEPAAGPDPSAAAATAVKTGDAELALVWGESGEVRILQRTDDGDVAVALVQQVLREHRTRDVFERSGVDPAVLDQVAAIVPAPVETVDAERGGRQAVAFGLTVAMYLVIMILASAVASAVATEKANRVSEVLLAVVPVRALLYGKVAGIAAVGLATVTVGALPVIVKALAGGDVPESLGTTLVSSGAWLAGGVVIYLLLAAMLGALADRTEDVGGAVAPLTAGLVAIYFVSLGTTETAVGVALSIVPLSSPIAMPARIAIGAATAWQIVLSLALLAVGIAVTARFTAWVYGRAIVRTGRRLKLIELVRSSRG